MQRVSRISVEGLKKIIGGKVKEDATCVIKFYSPECGLCVNLKDYYEEISKLDRFEDVHFFAFNVDDYPQIEKQLSFSGTPTIGVIKAYSTPRKPKIRIMPDPDNPNEHTWYKSREITQFIEEHK